MHRIIAYNANNTGNITGNTTERSLILSFVEICAFAEAASLARQDFRRSLST